MRRIHVRSARALLRAESATLEGMRGRVRNVVGQVVGNLATVRAEDTGRTLQLVHQASRQLASGLEADILMGRRGARDLALGQLSEELEEVSRQLSRIGIAEIHHPEVPPLSLTEVDALASYTSATSISAAWGAVAQSETLRAAATGQEAIPALSATVDTIDYRLRRTATTESARAFADEHEEGTDYLAGQLETASWAARLFRCWNAFLDRKTCSVCGGHDGEIVPVNSEFDGGDRPGFVHTGCRCTPTLVYLP